MTKHNDMLELAISLVIGVIAAVALGSAIRQSAGNFSGGALFLLSMVTFVFVAVLVRYAAQKGREKGYLHK